MLNTVVAAALTTALVGTLLGYLLGNRRLRYENLYQRRAQVLSKLSGKLYVLQHRVLAYVHLSQSVSAERNRQRAEAASAFDELLTYYNSNALWLEPETCDKIEAFLTMAYTNLGDYIDDIGERGHPQSREGRDAANRLLGEMQPLRRNLEAEFRAILYPAPWYDAPLRVLEWLQSRNRESAGGGG